jgi:hypothetical protein
VLSLTRTPNPEARSPNPKPQPGEYWSTSIISSRNWHTAGKAGIVMAPRTTKVLCSYYTDFGSFNRGCDVLPKKHRR